MKVHRLKEHVLAVFLVKPGLELGRFPGVVIPENGGVGWLPEHPWSLHTLNYLLRPISMMHINIDNGYALYLTPIDILHVCSSQCHIIYIAKAIGLLLVALIVLECLAEDAGMVTGRPYSAEGIAVGVGHDGVTGIYYSSGGM